MLTLTMALLTPLLVPTAQEATGSSVAIRADVIWVGDGRLLENAILLLADGRIAELGPDITVPDGVQVIEHKGYLTAGMIALHGYAGGSSGDMRDDARAALPDARVGLVFDPDSSDFAAARAAGITSVVLTPPAAGVAPGLTAVVKTAGRRVLKDEAHLSLVFTASGLVTNREPTSLSGAMVMLDGLFAKPSGAIERAAQGNLPCLFEATERTDILRTIEFAKKHGLSGAIHGVPLAGEVATQLKAAKLSVIVPAITVGEARRSLEATVALAKNGVPFGYGLDMPVHHPADLRLGAAMCVRAGLDSKTAWNALTSDAARIAGVADRVGKLDRGLDADVVLWSGDPLDLGSRIVAVYVGGMRVDGDKR